MKGSRASNIFRNFWYKVAALTLAVLIWGIVQGEEILEINHKMTVHINLPDGLIMKGDPVRRKDVTLRGPRVLLGEMTNRPIEAVVRVPDGVHGKRRILIGPDNLQEWDNRIRMTVHDPYVEVIVDEPAEKTVPVREVIQGAPAEGYFVEKVSIAPSSVTIQGLKADVRRIREAVTDPIDVTGLRQSRTIDVQLHALDLPSDNISPNIVAVTLQLGDSRINRRFTEIPVETVGSDYLALVRPQSVTIEIQGTPNTLNIVKRSDLRAFVDLSNVEPGTWERDVQVKIPPETVLIETAPEKVIVEISDRRRL